jgi:hypothetical protein
VRALAGAMAMLLGSILPRLATACAGCRNPNLPITRLSTVHLAPGEIRASAVASVTALNVVHEAGCADPLACPEVLVQPRFLHDQDIVPGELRAVAELGLSSTWGIEAQLPFRLTRTSVRYSTPDGAPYQPLDPEVHHRNETLAGLGDAWLLGRWGRSFAGTAVTARAGVTVPLGRTETDPFALGAEGKRHQHIQLGNGTFDPLLMVDVSRTIAPLDLSAYGQAQLTVHQSGRGFRAGNRYFTGLQAGAMVAAKVTTTLGLDLLSERPERWAGVVQQDGNLGRTELLGAVTLSRPFGRTTASLVGRFPLYRQIVEGDTAKGRLSSPLMLSLVVSRTFRSPI